MVGSGKTTVTRFFQELGAETMDIDEIVHDILQNNKKVRTSIRKSFGSDVFRRSGIVDGNLLRERAFQTKASRKQLEDAVHPVLLRKVKAAIKTWQKGKRKKIRILDIPLLFEVGMEDLMDRIIVVTAPKLLRWKRLSQYKNWDSKKCNQFERAQIPLQKKIGMADFVIDNSGSTLKTKRQVRGVWERLFEGQGSRVKDF